MRKHLAQIGITAAAILAFSARMIWPTLQIDGISVVLLIIAVAPWLLSVLKALELPGGLRLEFRDQVIAASEQARAAGLIPPPGDASEQPTYSFERVAEEDPKLALAGLRIELESTLSRWAEQNNIDAGRASVRKLLELLGSRELLTREEMSALADMVGLLNSAVHGREVDRQTADWALQSGKGILASLKRRMQ